MKKFIIWFLLFLVLLTTVFFVGWISFRVPAGESAIVYSKTAGWEHHLISADKFYWRLDAIIPTNISLYSFAPAEKEHTTSIQVQLPDAQSVLGSSQASQTAELAFTFAARFAVLPETWIARLSPVLAVTARDQFDASRVQIVEDLQTDLAKSIEASARSFASNWVWQALSNEGQQNVSAEAFTAALLAFVRANNGQVEFITLSADVQRYPDFTAFSQARSQYQQSTALSAQARLAADRIRLARETATRAGITLLEAYGEVLQKYPVLLEYFTLSSGSGADPLGIIESLRELDPAQTEEGP